MRTVVSVSVHDRSANSCTVQAAGAAHVAVPPSGYVDMSPYNGTPVTQGHAPGSGLVFDPRVTRTCDPHVTLPVGTTSFNDSDCTNVVESLPALCRVHGCIPLDVIDTIV